MGWSLPFAWAIVWTIITIPWVQSDLRREKRAWAENRGQGGIPWVDDISAPTARTRFASMQATFNPWATKHSPPSTPSEAPEKVPDGVSHGTPAEASGTGTEAPHNANVASHEQTSHEQTFGGIPDTDPAKEVSPV